MWNILFPYAKKKWPSDFDQIANMYEKTTIKNMKMNFSLNCLYTFVIHQLNVYFYSFQFYTILKSSLLRSIYEQSKKINFYNF